MTRFGRAADDVKAWFRDHGTRRRNITHAFVIWIISMTKEAVWRVRKTQNDAFAIKIMVANAPKLDILFIKGSKWECSSIYCGL